MSYLMIGYLTLLSTYPGWILRGPPSSQPPWAPSYQEYVKTHVHHIQPNGPGTPP